MNRSRSRPSGPRAGKQGPVGRPGAGSMFGPNCPEFAIPAPGDDWIDFDADCGFRLTGPDDLVEVPTQGIDTCMRQFETESCTVGSDSGWYSDPLHWLADEDAYVVGQATIGGAQAVVATARMREGYSGTQPHVAGAHFPAPFADSSDNSMTMFIACEDSAPRDALLPLLGTIRF